MQDGSFSFSIQNSDCVNLKSEMQYVDSYARLQSYLMYSTTEPAETFPSVIIQAG